MKFQLSEIEDLVPVAMRQLPELSTHVVPTGDSWLDTKFMEDIPIIGHTQPYYKLFWLIAKAFKPKFSVELGTYRAVAAGHFAVGNPDGVVYTIDWHRDSVDKVHQKSAIAMGEHYSNLSYLNGCSWDAYIIRKVAEMADDRPIDILFIDAWHKYEYAMREWNIYRPMLADEALVICDDIRDEGGATESMVQFWEEVSEGYDNFLDREGVHEKWIPMGFFKYVI